MKIEYLHEGSVDCPLVRLFQFDFKEASEFQELIGKLANGQVESIAIHDLSFVNTVGGCRLVFKTGSVDQGLVKVGEPCTFECTLNYETWKQVEGLVIPFCQPSDKEVYQWLDETSGISLMLSPSGFW